ncbi:MAG: hypothetical protein ABI134_32475 [Byssovorax sp.]
MDEKKLRFVFDDNWQVLKWDEHGAYVGGLRQFQSTKAVDFFGLYVGAPWFIEAKDFRGYRIANKSRLSSGELAKEIAFKVRDTLAAMVWACARTPLDSGEISGFLRPLVNRSEKVPVVLWLEEDRPATPVSASILAEAIKRELVWLNAKVIVASRALAQDHPIQGLTVVSLP